MTSRRGAIRGRRLSVLSAAICQYSPASPAWLDFVADCQARLKSPSNDDVIVPPDMWDYWRSVAAGENRDYDANGARTRQGLASRASMHTRAAPSKSMKATDLIGRRVRVLAHGAPLRVIFEDARPLTQTTEGTVTLFVMTNAGPIGLLNTDDGETVAFDCGADIKTGRIEIEVIKG